VQTDEAPRRPTFLGLRQVSEEDRYTREVRRFSGHVVARILRSYSG
jgi:hypothetical protein